MNDKKFCKVEDQIIISVKSLSICTELVANIVDSVFEKYVPVIKVKSDIVTVKTFT